MLSILYQDDYLVAINKPNGLLVHRSPIARNAEEFAVQLLRDQLQQFVYPVHRLDRKTSGVLLFALDKAQIATIQEQFTQKLVKKEYLAIVRGYFPTEISVDYPLTNDRGKTQEAITNFKRIETTEIAIPQGQFDTARYSLIEALPETGRMHQIRKHCNHLRHPIIGDRPHGCNKQNKLFKEKWSMTTMLLHARRLTFVHPILSTTIQIEATLPSEFTRMLEVLDFSWQEDKKFII